MTSLSVSKDELGRVVALLTIDRGAQKPLYKQIYEAFRTKIVHGELRAGQVVPSTRQLGRELKVSRFPVLNAYAQLLAEGYFESRIGSGTFIAASLPVESSGSSRTSAESVVLGLRAIGTHATALPRYVSPSWNERLGPFQVGQPDLEQFPRETWAKLVGRYSRKMQVNELQYGDAMGAEALRRAIAVYLRTSRAVQCEAEQIMIVSGSQQALDITTRVLLDSETQVWVEEPGYWLVHHVLTMAGCRPVPVPVDAEGVDVLAGINLSPKARAAFVAPSHQYPLGVTMSATRRLQLLEWAQNAGAWIIEDDYDSEYRYESPPISSLQGLDTNSRVIYIGTFSKVLFPSLRLGYIVIPQDLLERFAAVRQSMDLSPSPTNQAVLTEFIREGHFARHVRRMRQIYGERRRVLVKEIERELGSCCTIVGGEAGMHLTLLINGRFKDREIAARAAARKLWLSALSLSYVGETSQHGFVLGFGNTRVSEIPKAVRLLKELLNA
jgi:GntR family transcriptional regulator/MocR family aminotransferase